MDANNSEIETRWAGGELLVCAVVQLILVNIAYRIDQNRDAPLLSTSSWAIFMGIVCGAILLFVSEKRVHNAGLDPQLLFFGLLPPIMLEAGFNTQRKGFFNNFWVILLLAIIGTLIATFVTGGILFWLGQQGWITSLSSAEVFLYGSLISAIDPVATLMVFKKCHAPSMLFHLVFGESVLNDAVAIVIFTLFQQFVESGQTHVTLSIAFQMIWSLIGIGLGSVAMAGVICCSSAYYLRWAEPTLHDHPTYEISILLLSSYASYVAADCCHLSGLLAVFFSGVFLRHYHMYSLSPSSASAFTHLLSTIAFLSENFIYLYLGISVVAYHNSFEWDGGFVVATVIACVLARAGNTFPLCTLVNQWCRQEEQIPLSYQIVIWFSGLRGAIAFALALNVQASDPHHAAIIRSATLFMVLFTTVFFGMGTGPLLKAFHLDQQPNRSSTTRSRRSSHTQSRFDWNEEIEPLLSTRSTTTSHWNIRDTWVELDESYFKPLFGGNPRTISNSMTSNHNYSSITGSNNTTVTK